MYDNTIIVYYAILTMILDDTINHEKITYVIQSNLVSEYTWGPSKLLLTISSTC